MAGTISLDGIASSLDTTSIINSLLSVAGANLNVIKKHKADAELKLNHWQTFNTHLSDLKSAIEAINSANEFTSSTVTSSDSSKVSASVSGTALSGTYEIEVSQVATSQITKSTTTWASGDDAFTSGTSEISIAVNGGAAETISLSTNSLDGAIAAINDADLGVLAYKVLDSTNQYVLVLAGEQTGEDYDFSISLPADVSDVSFEATNTSEAKSTLATVNGIQVKSSTRNLTDIVPGLTISANDVTSSSVNLVVSLDTEGIKTHLNDFIEKYNTVLSYITYEVKLNDESQKPGPLSGDSTLIGIQRTLQSLIGADYTSNTLNSLALFGITTKSDGTLELDDTKLNDALNNNLTETIDFFTGSSGFFQALTNVSQNGSLDLLLDSAEGTVKTRIDTIDDQIEEFNDRITREETRLDKVEDTLRAKFTQLEVILGTLKSTQSYVTNVLGQNKSDN